MVQDPLAGCDGVLIDGLGHQVGQCRGKLVRLPPAQHLGEISLGVGVHQQDFLSLLGKANTQAGGCGGFPHAALLICQCDGFQKHTSISCNKKEPSGSCSDSILFYPLPPLRSWPTISA